MPRPLRSLILDDSPDDAELMARELKRAGFSPEIVRVDKRPDFLLRLKEEFHIALLDFRIPGFGGLDAVDLLKKQAPQIPIVMVSGSIGDEMAAECIRKGAFDYVLKSHLQRLGPAAQKALEHASLQSSKRRAEMELRQAHERLDLLARITGVVVGSRSLTDQARELTDQVRGAFDADTCAALALEGDQLHLLACSGKGADPFPSQLSASTEILQPILSRKEAVSVAGENGDGAIAKVLPGKTPGLEYASFAGAPILVEDQVAGILAVFTSRRENFSETDLDHLQVAASHLAVAIANDRLYERVQCQQEALETEVAERKHAEQTSAAFARLGKQLSIATNLEEAAAIVSQTAKEMLGWDSFSLDLFEPEGDLLETILTIDLERGHPQKVLPAKTIRPASTLIKKVIAEGPQLILRGSNPKFSDDLDPFGDMARPSASLLFVPLVLRERAVGVLTSQSYSADAYTLEDLKTVSSLAEHCTGAFDRINSQLEFKNLFEHALDGICRSLLDGRIISANPAMASLLGHGSVEDLTLQVVDLRTQVFANPDDYDKYIQLLESRNAVRLFEIEFKRVDGDKIWVSINGRAVRHSGGKVVCYETIAEDVTVRRKGEELLRQTEELYRMAIRAAGAVAYSYDFRNSRYLFLDERVEDLTGYAPDEFTDELWPQITLESHMRGAASGLSKARALEMARAGELRNWLCDSLIRTRQGALKWITDSSVQRLNATGEPMSAVGILQDITELKFAVETLSATEQTYRKAIAAVGAVPYCYEIGADCYTFIGEGIKELTGYGVDEITPVLWERMIQGALVRGESAGLTWHEALQRYRSGQVQNWKCDVHIRTPSGQNRWISDGATPLLNEKNLVTGFVGVLQDVTERKEAEQKIREQASLLDLSSDSICLANMNQEVVFWNRGAERIYGWAASEAIGKNVTDVLFRGDSAKPSEIIKSLIRSQQWTGEIKQFKKAGEEIIMESRWTLVRNENGQPRGILIIGSDITEKKKLESQFLRAQRLESIGTLASGIAHDLNNVLAPILMSIDLLRESVNTDGDRSILSSLQTSAKRGAEIVKHLLTFARGIGGDRILVQPKFLLAELAKILRGTIPKDISIKTNTPNDLWVVLGDTTQLHQVLLNLCVNARDAMPEGGSLRIEASNVKLDDQFASMSPGAKAGPYVRIDVIDSGTGIAPEDLDKIFDPFFTTKEPGMGTGLGLSSTLGIVKSHDGFVTVQSKLDHGTTFSIFLPAKPREAHQSIDTERTPANRGQGELLLVADDEPSIREITQRTLEARGYRTLVAEDGAQALTLFAQHKDQIDAVITDLAMPSMDGLALARAVKKMRSNAKIIVSTGHGQSEKIAELKSMGLRTFLNKPYTAERLLAALKEELHAP